MRNLIIYLAVVLCTLVTKSNAQERKSTFETRAFEIATEIEKITKEEKEALKNEIEIVNQELDKGIITREQADQKKLQLATKSATAIETRVSEQEDKLSQLVKDKIDGKLLKSDTTNKRKISIVNITFDNSDKKSDTIKKEKEEKGEKRTTSQFVFAAGFNNLITNGTIAKSDFRYFGSHFYEIGLTGNTRILKTNNLLHLKYGVSLMYNNLRPTNKRFFTENGFQTNLVNSPLNLNDSRFKTINMVVPLHLEFDFTPTKTDSESKSYFKTHDSFRIGIGGFAGFNIGTRQYLKYELDNHDYKVKEKGNFNTNDFVYGLSTYVGYQGTSLYLKYDLNPLFTNNSIKQNNVSLGLRFDLN
jgi:hypothetical protein